VYTNFLGNFVVIMFYVYIFIQRRSEELACATREQADSANGVGNSAPSGSRGSGVALPFSATHNVSTYGDEFDTTIITFNMVCLAM
jgi:CCR4-NOT transcription complex subunit 10